MASAPFQRDSIVDLLRTSALLYIVGFWHLFEYSDALSFHKTPITGFVTKLCLGLFIFISGYLLGQRYHFQCWAEVWRFYRRRLLRIYPLYAIALTLFLTCGLINATTYGRALFFTTLLPYRPLTTLWFISVIIVCYAVTPLYLHRYSIGKTVALTLFLVLPLWALVFLTDGVDLRLPLYLPAFAYGLVVGREGAIAQRFNQAKTAAFGLVVTLLGGSAALMLSTGPVQSPLQFLMVDVALLGAMPLAWFGARNIAQKLPLQGKQALAWLSYGSFAAYLIHRVTFWLGLALYSPTGLGPALLYWLGLVLPITLILAFAMQWAYDRWLVSLMAK